MNTKTFETTLHTGVLGSLIPTDIVCLVAESNYTTLYFSNGTRNTTSYHLAKVHALVSCQCMSFVRVNRSTVINLNHVDFYNNDYLKLGDAKFHFSRRRKKQIYEEIDRFFTNRNSYRHEITKKSW